MNKNHYDHRLSPARPSNKDPHFMFPLHENNSGFHFQVERKKGVGRGWNLGFASPGAVLEFPKIRGEILSRDWPLLGGKSPIFREIFIFPAAKFSPAVQNPGKDFKTFLPI